MLITIVLYKFRFVHEGPNPPGLPFFVLFMHFCGKIGIDPCRAAGRGLAQHQKEFGRENAHGAQKNGRKPWMTSSNFAG
jgi:hypothetical protein